MTYIPNSQRTPEEVAKLRLQRYAAQQRFRKKNPEHAAERAAIYRKRHPDRVATSLRASHLKHSYGITPAQWDAILAAQGGGCAICGTKQGNKRTRLHLDHNHATKAVRGLLCGPCNVLIGMAQEHRERLDQAIAYLELNPSYSTTIE